MWILLPRPYCQVTYAGSNSNRVGRAGMLKGQTIKGHVSCPPAYIHQRLAFDAPNLLIFVQGSIKNPSSRASHLFPFHPLLSCRQCIYYLLGSSCVPCPPHPLELPSPSAPCPLHTYYRACRDRCPGSPGCVWAPPKTSCRQGSGG